MVLLYYTSTILMQSWEMFVHYRQHEGCFMMELLLPQNSLCTYNCKLRVRNLVMIKLNPFRGYIFHEKSQNRTSYKIKTPRSSYERCLWQSMLATLTYFPLDANN